MPKLIVEGVGEFEVSENKRLVLALREEAGVQQLHSCGGKAKCTACQVEFVAGEPKAMTEAEAKILEAKNVQNARLSCQILCSSDMTVRAKNTLENSDKKDCGTMPGQEIEPEPVWVER